MKRMLMAQECVLLQTFAETADAMNAATMHLVAQKFLTKGLMSDGECATLLDAALVEEVKKDGAAHEELTKTAMKMELDHKYAALVEELTEAIAEAPESKGEVPCWPKEFAGLVRRAATMK